MSRHESMDPTNGAMVLEEENRSHSSTRKDAGSILDDRDVYSLGESERVQG